MPVWCRSCRMVMAFLVVCGWAGFLRAGSFSAVGVLVFGRDPVSLPCACE